MDLNLIAFLKAQPTVTALVGDRVVLVAAAENVKRPLVVLFRTNTQPTHTKTGPTGDVRATFELHCLSADPGGMVTLGKAVRQALNGFKGDMGGIPVSYAGISNERDAFEPDAGLYVRILEGFIWYTE